MLRTFFSWWLLALVISPCTAPFSVSDLADLFGPARSSHSAQGTIASRKAAVPATAIPMRMARRTRTTVRMELSTSVRVARVGALHGGADAGSLMDLRVPPSGGTRPPILRL